VEELAEKLKAARNRRAQELGIDRGALVANALITAIATMTPSDEASLARVDGIRNWQVEAAGAALLKVLRQAR
jgi:ribonuclease D